MRFLRASMMLCAVCLPLLAGCRADEEIRLETIPHVDREWMILRVAILKEKDHVWFFRLDGPEAQVNEHRTAFNEFVKSVKFTEKKEEPATWTEPKGWKKDPPMPQRYASYRIDSRPKPMEVKITFLPADKYNLMDNMHRWQRQINVPLSESQKDNDDLMTIEKIKGSEQEVAWVELKGLSVHTLSKPPNPKAANEKGLLPGMEDKGPRVPFTYAPPKGWVKKGAGKMAVDAYEVAEGSKSAEITLTPSGGDLAANINRWRGQVGLDEQSKEEIAKSVKLIMVAGVQSFLVDLANPAGPPGKNRILGVIIPGRRSSWFIKMTGPLEFVGQHKNDFEKFAESFKK